MVTITVGGHKEILRKLARLSRTDAKKALRKGSRAAAKILAAEVKLRAPVNTGALRRAIKVRAMPRSRTQVGTMVLQSEGFYKGDQFYAGFQEFGWKTGNRYMAMSERRQIPGRHYTRDAFQAKGEQARAVFRDVTLREIDKLIARG